MYSRVHFSLAIFLYGIIKQWHCGGVVTQRSAKPRTPVQFRSVPPNPENYNLGPSGGIGIRVRLKIEWNLPYGFKSHLGHQTKNPPKEGYFVW